MFLIAYGHVGHFVSRGHFIFHANGESWIMNSNNEKWSIWTCDPVNKLCKCVMCGITVS